MASHDLTRRQLLVGSGAALAAWALLDSPWFAHAFPSRAGEAIVPFLDPPPAPPRSGFNLLDWEQLDSWITPTDKFFQVAHYDRPQLDPATWTLEVAGLVRQPRTYTLAELRALSRVEVIYTLECSGNHGFPWLTGAIGNAKWRGTPLAPLLSQTGVQPGGGEVVFFGHDAGEETVRDIKMKQNFARSMSLDDAMSPANLLCYEMNGAALPTPHGFPVRLIAPGWYGIANVKWLKRIEVRPSRYMGRFMARDYVTIREEIRSGESVWTETSVGRARLKSAPAKVTRKDGQYRIYGAAWGGPIARVELRIDNGAWTPAAIDRTEEAEHAWRIWTLDWPSPTPGEHAITSRAIDTQGNVQPAPTDPIIANKKTYWESNGQVTRRIRIT